MYLSPFPDSDRLSTFRTLLYSMTFCVVLSGCDGRIDQHVKVIPIEAQPNAGSSHAQPSRLQHNEATQVLSELGIDMFEPTANEGRALISTNYRRSPERWRWEMRTPLTEYHMSAILAFDDTEVMDLGWFPVSDTQLEQLSNLQHCRELSLASTVITNDGLRHIDRMNQLRYLSIPYSQVSSGGLSGLQRLPNLERLNLRHTLMDDSAIPLIAAIQSLQIVDVSYTKITDKGLEILQKMRPDLGITIVRSDGSKSRS